jgi:putative oxygen-independent coproporphyrinogen III oxidase
MARAVSCFLWVIVGVVLFISPSNSFSIVPKDPSTASRGRTLVHYAASLPTSVSEATVTTTLTTNTQDGGDSPIGLYVHIPYCRRRCRYCDFPIVPIGPAAASAENDDADKATRGFYQMDQSYLQSILAELRGIQRNATDPIPLQSIYFGGGTPSLAPLESIRRIMEGICRTEDAPFLLEPNAEVSIEMDPGTFDLSYVQSLKELGFNRISLGGQSFDDDILEGIGRIHRKKDIYEALQMIQDVYGDDANYSIDLISGLPGLTLAKWAETLQLAASLQPRPSHMSIYDLQVEAGTVFGKWYAKKEKSLQVASTSATAVSPLPSEDECAFMYKYAAGYLRSKHYEHYEVSSYAYIGDNDNHKPNPSSRRSRHNQIYWSTTGQWYAIGLGATSFVNGRQVARPRTLVEYAEWVQQQSSRQQGSTPKDASDGNLMDDQEYLTDIVMKRLRTSDGLDLDWLTARFGKDITQKVVKGASLGLELNLAERIRSETGEELLRLANPDGLLFSNYIISSIFVELGYDE